jgi:hypothetical protein
VDEVCWGRWTPCLLFSPDIDFMILEIGFMGDAGNGDAGSIALGDVFWV